MPFIDDKEQVKLAKQLYSEGIFSAINPKNIMKNIGDEFGLDSSALFGKKPSGGFMAKVATRAVIPDVHNARLVSKMVKNFLIKTDNGYRVDPEIENTLGRGSSVVKELKQFADTYSDFKDSGGGIFRHRERADLAKLASQIQDDILINHHKDMKNNKKLEKKFDKLTPGIYTPEFWRSKLNINRLIKNYPMATYLDDNPRVKELKKIMKSHDKTSYEYRNALGMFEKHLAAAKATQDPKNNLVGYWFNRTTPEEKLKKNRRANSIYN